METAVTVTGVVGFMLAVVGGGMLARNWVETRLSEHVLARQRGKRPTAYLDATVRVNRGVAPYLVWSVKIGSILMTVALILAIVDSAMG